MTDEIDEGITDFLARGANKLASKLPGVVGYRSEGRLRVLKAAQRLRHDWDSYSAGQGVLRTPQEIINFLNSVYHLPTKLARQHLVAVLSVHGVGRNNIYPPEAERPQMPSADQRATDTNPAQQSSTSSAPAQQSSSPPAPAADGGRRIVGTNSQRVTRRRRGSPQPDQPAQPAQPAQPTDAAQPQQPAQHQPVSQPNSALPSSQPPNNPPSPFRPSTAPKPTGKSVFRRNGQPPANESYEPASFYEDRTFLEAASARFGLAEGGNDWLNTVLTRKQFKAAILHLAKFASRNMKAKGDNNMFHDHPSHPTHYERDYSGHTPGHMGGHEEYDVRRIINSLQHDRQFEKFTDAVRQSKDARDIDRILGELEPETRQKMVLALLGMLQGVKK